MRHFGVSYKQGTSDEINVIIGSGTSVQYYKDFWQNSGFTEMQITLGRIDKF